MLKITVLLASSALAAAASEIVPEEFLARLNAGKMAARRLQDGGAPRRKLLSCEEALTGESDGSAVCAPGYKYSPQGYASFTMGAAPWLLPGIGGCTSGTTTWAMYGGAYGSWCAGDPVTNSGAWNFGVSGRGNMGGGYAWETGVASTEACAELCNTNMRKDGATPLPEVCGGYEYAPDPTPSGSLPNGIHPGDCFLIMSSLSGLDHSDDAAVFVQGKYVMHANGAANSNGVFACLKSCDHVYSNSAAIAIIESAAAPHLHAYMPECGCPAVPMPQATGGGLDYEEMTCNGTDYIHRYDDRAACCEDLSEAELAVFLAGLDASSIEEGCNAHQYY